MMINPWLRWKVQGFFLSGRDFRFQVKGHKNMKILQYLQILELVSQDNPKTKQKCVFTKS